MSTSSLALGIHVGGFPPVGNPKLKNRAISLASDKMVHFRDLFVNLHQKFTDSTKSLNSEKPTSSPDSPSFSVSTSDSEQRSKWRPSLKLICNDKELLNALIAFTRKRFNEENILFLQAATKLTNDINNILSFKLDVTDSDHVPIDKQIHEIYQLYIISGADRQINLSSDCFHSIMSKETNYSKYTMLKKKSLFTMCFAEISHLVSDSIVQDFYQTDEFQSIAKSRNLLHNKYAVHKQFLSESSDGETDVDHSQEFKNEIEFDIKSTQYMLSSQCVHSGYHEWSAEIQEYDGNRIEFGIVGESSNDININKYGIRGAYAFGSRAVYGCDEHKFFYASYNSDNTTRCSKDLSSLNMHQAQFKKGDIIKICLNLNKGNIKFYRNGKKVRKTISIEKNNYYPIISFSGSNCRFRTIQ